MASDPVRDAYTERVRRDLNLEVRAVDLGQFAGGTTAACFWLSLAAGLAHVQWEVPGQALPVLAEVPALLAKVREKCLSDLDHRPRQFLCLRVQSEKFPYFLSIYV